MLQLLCETRVVFHPNQNRWLEVPTSVATLHESGAHGGHSAVDTFQHWYGNVLVRWRPLVSFDSGITLIVVLWWSSHVTLWKEPLCKSRQEAATRRKFWSWKVPWGTGMVTAHNRQRAISIIDVCVESELIEVKVPIVCLVTEGVSSHRDGH